MDKKGKGRGSSPGFAEGFSLKFFLDRRSIKSSLVVAVFLLDGKVRSGPKGRQGKGIYAEGVTAGDVGMSWSGPR